MNNGEYYYFDDEKREVVFNRHDMPSPWLNYLFNGEFFTMISHAGGNLSWYKSPECWRIGRYNFYNMPVDVSGMFLYITDLSTGKTFNPTVIPCNEKPDEWQSAHGLGYTRFFAKKDGLKVEVKYFVGRDNALICDISLTAETDRQAILFACQEMGLMEYLKEVQWQCYVKNSNNILHDAKTDALVYEYFTDMQPRPDETPLVYFVADRKCSSYDGSRRSFIGNYRDLKNPVAIERGRCLNGDLLGGEAMFSTSYDLNLKGGKTEKIHIFLGTVNPDQTVEEVVKNVTAEGYADKAFKQLQNDWNERLSVFNVEIPDKSCERMMNYWNELQSLVNFHICREISFYATGTVRGIGVRDASQDVLGVIPTDLQAAKDKIKLIMGQQYVSGKTNHYFYPVEKREPLISDRSDNHLWMIYAVYSIVCEEGKLDILNDIVPYYDGGEGTVFEHLEKSLHYALSHLGADGIPLMLGSDWNDMLSNVCKKGKGESVFVAEMIVLACKNMMELCKATGRDYSEYEEAASKQTELINGFCWDKEWYIRAVTDDGMKLGKKGDECAEIWLNSQSWAVISGAADETRGKIAMQSVMDKLDCGYGLLKLAPPLKRNYPSKENELTFAQPGIAENGGVFCHADTWAIIAQCMLGNHEQAYKIYKELLPSSVAELYTAEPYIYSSNIRGPLALNAGQAGVSWLTGTASWMTVAVREYIFGIKPQIGGLKIQPCLPDAWKEVKIHRKFRGTDYEIIVDNSAACGNKVKEIILLNAEMKDGLIVSSCKNAKVKVITG